MRLLLRPLFSVLFLLASASAYAPATAAPGNQSGGAALSLIERANARLQAAGAGYAVEAIDFFTIGEARPSVRIHQQEFRWVPFDERRVAQGAALTYLVDGSDGKTSSGVRASDTEAAIDAAMNTWAANGCLGNVPVYKVADPGQDPDIFDSFFGFGREGYPFYADIVHAGWLPGDYFEAAGGPGGGRGILAFSVTFVFTDEAGNPTDINGDNFLDTALNEVYYNDAFGGRGYDREGNSWAIGQDLPAIDVQTVSFHESGHSLGLGHFGPPPDAVMNPRYAGIRLTAYSSDESGMCANYQSWPN